MNILFIALYAAIQFVGFVLSLRFMLQLCRVDIHNPLSQSILSISNPLTEWLRKLLPDSKNIDPASLIILVAFNAGYIALSAAVQSQPVSLATVISAGVILTLIAVFNVVRLAIVGEVILSWLGPAAHQSPLFPVVYKINSPVLNPVRRVIPAMGGLDLTPMIVLFVIHFVVIGFLQGALAKVVLGAG